jgi:hypothetical protein
LALAARIASLGRNARIRHKSSLQTAIGVAKPGVRQISQGFTGNSFNTIEFFHGVPAARMRQLRIVFLLLGFVVPSALLAAALMSQAPSWSSSVSPLPALLALTFVVQYGGIAAILTHPRKPNDRGCS